MTEPSDVNSRPAAVTPAASAARTASVATSWAPFRHLVTDRAATDDETIAQVGGQRHEHKGQARTTHHTLKEGQMLADHVPGYDPDEIPGQCRAALVDKEPPIGQAACPGRDG